ncbi:MAG: nuclear transport factor 2 family protein [Actinomycetota bacterium]
MDDPTPTDHNRLGRDPAHSTALDVTALEVVSAYCDAWLAGDAMAVVALYHDDLTLTWPGRHHLAGVHRGREASIEALLALGALADREPVEIVDLLAGRAGAIAVVRERWTRPTADAEAAGGPASIEITRALDYTVIDGRLATCRVFELDQPAIDDWLGEAVHCHTLSGQ